MSTNCKNCTNRCGCWIKNVLDFKTPAPRSGRDLEIVLSASRGDCPLYEEAQ